MKPKYKMNMLAGGLVFAFGAAYGALSLQISDFKGLGAPPIDARFVPQLWAGILMVLSLIVFLRGLREYLTLKKAGALTAKGEGLMAKFGDRREVILTFTCLLFYILLLQPIGFIIMSALYIFAESMILTPAARRKPLIAGIVAIAAAVLIDYAFVNLLHVLLPAGILGW